MSLTVSAHDLVSTYVKYIYLKYIRNLIRKPYVKQFNWSTFIL